MNSILIKEMPVIGRTNKQLPVYEINLNMVSAKDGVAKMQIIADIADDQLGVITCDHLRIEYVRQMASALIKFAENDDYPLLILPPDGLSGNMGIHLRPSHPAVLYEKPYTIQRLPEEVNIVSTFIGGGL
jgi:hypothetical protein